LAKNIKENETKINHHGKRADAIVKSMLQHSRKSSGQKELTDINALCDEYLRLSYHGLRAKDKSFNADFATKFDTTLAPINVEPQDIGRVILNLINNAFYAVNERQKKEQDSGYKPMVTLTTSKQGDQVVIEVADNGTGMTEQVKEKIFQPFFTTKPTGEGTGLGLSLSYDIVKAHGGVLHVETIPVRAGTGGENAGTNITINIPTN
jgi:signal transduction histidine kinase